MKKPIPEMTTARRWNRLVGASSSSWLTVGLEGGGDPLPASGSSSTSAPWPVAALDCPVTPPLWHNIQDVVHSMFMPLD